MVMPASPMGPAASGAPSGSPMTGPSPSPGAKAEALAQVRQALKILEGCIPKLGADSEEGGQLVKIVGQLGKMSPANESLQGMESTALRDLQARAKQQAPLLALQSQGGGAQQGAPSGQVPGA